MPTGAFFGVGLFLVIGLACVIGAVVTMMRERQRVRTWCVADAVVIENVTQPSSEGLQVPAVEFTDVHGDRVRVFSAFARSRAQYKAGDVVRVCYQPEHPRDARIIGEMRGTLIWTMAVGIIVSVIAAALMVSMIGGA